LVPRLKKSKIDISRLYFIDAATKSGDFDSDNQSDNCTIIQGPGALTEISLAVTTAANTGKFQFLLFDSLSTLTVYNGLKTVEKFSTFLLSKIRNLNFSGIVLVLNEDVSNQLIPIVSQFCDYKIEVK
jgi:archaellum biogenesis ATPase FlaH